MLSLWSAISGGNDWMEYAETLRTMEPGRQKGLIWTNSFLILGHFSCHGFFRDTKGLSKEEVLSFSLTS